MKNTLSSPAPSSPLGKGKFDGNLRARKKIESILDHEAYYNNTSFIDALNAQLRKLYGEKAHIQILKRSYGGKYYNMSDRSAEIISESDEKHMTLAKLKPQRGSDGFYMHMFPHLPDGTTEGSIIKISGIEEKDADQVLSGMRELRDQFLKTDAAVYIHNQDPLTGLYNRFFIKRYAKERDTKKDKTYVVIAIDLYNLAGHNTLGLHVGDGVLKKVAEVLKGRFGRESDIVARPGGDEFTIVIEFEPNTPVEKQTRIVTDMMEGVEKTLRDGENGKGTFSIEGEEREISLYWGAGYGDNQLSFHQKHQNADRASKADKKLDSAAVKFSDSAKITTPTIRAIRTTLEALDKVFGSFDPFERSVMLSDLSVFIEKLRSEETLPNPSKFKAKGWLNDIREANQLDKKSGKE